ncbi:MAG TPA: hypothetical protein VL985_04070 [Stellaceae bacterium]|nr:hypothetical protein [Stellaceae bacterium]
MLINNLACMTSTDRRVLSAEVVWEDHDFPRQELLFEVGAPRRGNDRGDAAAEPIALQSSDDDLRPEAFLAAVFPLAAVHGEARVRIEGRPCPMLIEGLRTAHAWWLSWGGMPGPAPVIETVGASRRQADTGPRRAVACLSGGVDSLHLLLHNHRRYSPDDPAYIRTALFIHGFDIGKRPLNPERDHYDMILDRFETLAAATGISILPCRTNLRHLPSLPGFWTHRHNGAALAAAGHAAIDGPAFLFIGSTYHLSELVPLGSHPAVDVQFSSQRLAVIHEGARFSRVDKVRELATWPTALALLRVCPSNIKGVANCGVCEKCLETRLELLAAGVEETGAFGPSLTPIELWQATDPVPSFDRALRYEPLLAPLRALGHLDLCQILSDKIAAYRQHVKDGVKWPDV